MKFPKMNRSRQVSVTVPQMNGGVNFHDSPSMVNDNQLVSVDNMWYHGGMLRTRPGMKGMGDARWLSNDSAPFIAEIMQEQDETTVLRATIGDAEDGENYIIGAGVISSARMEKPHRKNGNVFAFRKEAAGEHPTAFGIRRKDELLYFLSSGDIITCPRDDNEGNGYGTWAKKTAYVPTVMINGYGIGAQGGDNDEANAVYEDYNALSRGFKCRFTTDGECYSFQLPAKDLGRSEDGTAYAVVELTVHGIPEFQSAPKTSTYTITIAEKYGEIYGETNLSPTEAGVSSEYDYVVVRAILDPVQGTVSLWVTTFRDGNAAGTYPFKLPRITNNNLTVTAWTKSAQEGRLEVCRMTHCAWYGGTRSGLSGGIRLFVGGNPAEPNLIRWSGTDNPLFFPELNSLRVGDDTQAVTAFGKQGGLLVIFKEREIYVAEYVAGEQDDYSFAKEAGVSVDTYTAKFPITQISSTVGCDCPHSIRLVNNRLVWLNSDGRVYMLVAMNQNSELCVREMSRNIRPLLLKHSAEERKAAIAGELDGYYLLLVGKKIYLLDAQSSAFTNFGYYSDEEKAQKALPWYVWSLREEYDYYGMVADGNTLLLMVKKTSAVENTTQRHLLVAENGGADEVVYAFSEVEAEKAESTTVTHPVACHFTTKLFAFGGRDLRKAVEQIYVDATDDAEGEIDVFHVTEHGTWEDSQSICLRGEGGVRTVRLTPNIHRARLFGLRLSSQSSMAVENILIKTRRQGVVR